MQGRIDAVGQRGAQRTRAVVLDRLCNALQSSNLAVELAKQPQTEDEFALVVSDARGAIRVSLIEKTVHTPHVPTEREKE